MRRLTIISLAAMLLTTTLASAAMTDEQIISYVQAEQAKGTKETTIASQLLAKGATMSQLQKLKNKYSSSTGSSTSAADLSRLRNAKALAASTTGTTTAGTGTTATTAAKAPTAATTTSTRSFFDNPFFDIEESRIYGQNIFRNEMLTFEPNVNAASPADYQLGAGDELIIDIYGASQKTIRSEISPDGCVIIEEVGPVRVSGLNLEQAEKRMQSVLGSRYSSSQISVTLGNLRTIVVNIMGEVLVPGTYTLSGFASVFHALYSAGGVNDLGTLRDIKIYRNNKLEAEVDIYDYIMKGQADTDIRLCDNDMIVVGSYLKHVDITGYVKRPMIYELKGDETMQTLLDFAGGFDANAYTNSVRVVRKTSRELAVFNVQEDALATFVMQDGDSVSVDKILDDRYANTVEIKGAVFHPGLFELNDKVKTVGDLINMAEGVTEQAFTARGVMHRMKTNRTLEVLSVDVEGILNGSAPDIELRENDVLFIPEIQEAAEEQTVRVHGKVINPGVYPYADNQTLEDIILQAGGLTKDASTAKVDVARRKLDPAATTKPNEAAEVFSFTLKEGFVVDGTQGFTLMPFDEIYVRQSPGSSRLMNITINGEVLYPGNYSLAAYTSRLSDVVKQAGGVTDFAFTKGAFLKRIVTDEEKEKFENLKAIIGQNRTYYEDEEDEEDEEDLINDSLYVIGIQLEKAIADPGGVEDLIIKEGDVITIPSTKQTVAVSGNVNFPVTTTFIDGKKAKYYIRMAGGYGARAKKRSAFVVNMNGNAEIARKAKIIPGCQIVVPTKPEAKMSVTQWLAVGTSAASLATMVATIVNLTN